MTMTTLKPTVDDQFAAPPGGGDLEAGQPEQPLSFEDIEPWMEVTYCDDVYLVANIGPDIRPEEGQHVDLWSMYNERSTILHEDWVNLWLRRRRRIHPWVIDDA